MSDTQREQKQEALAEVLNMDLQHLAAEFRRLHVMFVCLHNDGRDLTFEDFVEKHGDEIADALDVAVRREDRSTDRAFIQAKWQAGAREAEAGADRCCPYEANSLAGMWWLRGYDSANARRAALEEAEQACRDRAARYSNDKGGMSLQYMADAANECAEAIARLKEQ